LKKDLKDATGAIKKAENELL
jgi:chromosome segregation ATPase